jgi:hypothetical protein
MHPSLDDIQATMHLKITIPVTRILLTWVLCLVLCAIYGFTKEEAKGALMGSTIILLIFWLISRR